MANINENIDNINVNNIENVNMKNCANIPKSWIKCGEVFYNEKEQPIFICSICLKIADSINTAYSTRDGSVLWWHIQQQHISVECETLDKISAEIETYEKNNVDYGIACCEINSKKDSASVDDKMKENQINLLHEFHEKVVESRKTLQSAPELDIKIETPKIPEEGPPSDLEAFTKVIKLENTEQPQGTNFSNCNYYYDETAIYTISDEEEFDEEAETPDSNVRHYLKHNDMIEISDEEDNVETRPNSPTLNDEDTTMHETVDRVENNNSTQSIEPAENYTQPVMNYVNTIPTPDASPCESGTNEKYNYNSLDRNDDSQPKETQHVTKKIAKSYRPFRCKVCGRRTITEQNMQNHIEKFHKSALQEFENNYRPHQQPYHQLPPCHQTTSSDLLQNYMQRNPFKCKSCKRRTKSIKSMERHQQLYHSPNAHLLTKKCEMCQQRILNEHFQEHIQLHLSTGFNCPYCGVVYRLKIYMEKHIRKYHANASTNYNSLAGNSQHFRMMNTPTMPYQGLHHQHQNFGQNYSYPLSTNYLLPPPQYMR